MQTSAQGANYSYENGFLITTQNDTIYGLISRAGTARPYNACMYKKTKKEEAIRYEPSAVKAYFIDGKVPRVSRQVKIEGAEDTVFLDVLVNGKIKLYKYIYFSNTLFFVQKDEGPIDELTNDMIKTKIDGNVIILNSERYKTQLKYLFADCPAMTKRLTKAVLQEARLTDLVEEYNACIGLKPYEK